MQRSDRWPVIGSFLIGAVFLLPAAILSRDSWRLLDAWETAPGIVVGMVPDEAGEGPFPSVSFATPDGQAHTFRDRLGASLSPAVGSPVEVLYDPAAPSRARVKSFLSLWLPTLVFGGFGAACVGVGLAIGLGVGEGAAPR
jgi:hypothetical protein